MLENAGINEKNDDGTISDDEGEARESLLAMVESELDELFGKIDAEAMEIGGEFRAPGIKHQIKKMIEQKMIEWTRGKIEYLTRLPKSQGGDLPDDYPMADPTGTLKRDIDGNIGPTR